MSETVQAADAELDEVCGETWDHTLDLIEERDGIRTEVCRECGAELMSDAEDGDAIDTPEASS